MLEYNIGDEVVAKVTGIEKYGIFHIHSHLCNLLATQVHLKLVTQVVFFFNSLPLINSYLESYS